MKKKQNCCERFADSVRQKEISHAKGNDETEWYIEGGSHIYYCPYCGQFIKGKGWGEYDTKRKEKESKTSWFIADLLIEMRIEKEPRNVVHINSHLIRATSDADAKRKAKEIGKQSSNSYKNTDGRNVKVRFRGIRALFELPEGVEDRAEILWEEHIGLTESKIKSWLRPASKKSKSRRNIPNYMPESVMEDLEKAGFDRKELMNR